MGKRVKRLNIWKCKHGGFSGITHWLFAILLFFILWTLPYEFPRQYVQSINTSIPFAIMIFFIMGGSALAPDLDSSPLQEGGSTAVYQLGALGYGLSIICITLSGVIHSIFHTKYDDRPESQHRMFFHTLIVPIALYLYGRWNIPKTTDTLMDHWGWDSLPIILVVFLAAISVYLGSTMLIYKVLKLINKQKYTQWICLAIMAISVYFILNMEYYRLNIISTTIALGYASHVITDLFSQGSAPIFFPIPTFKSKKMVLWRKPYLLGNSSLAIRTGGLINIVLNFALMGINVFMFWNIFIK